MWKQNLAYEAKPITNSLAIYRQQYDNQILPKWSNLCIRTFVY